MIALGIGVAVIIGTGLGTALAHYTSRQIANSVSKTLRERYL